MQEQALQTAQARIAELEDEVARRPAGSGFLSGLFGGGNQPQTRPLQRQPDNMQGMAPPGGGFGSGITAPGMAAQPGRGGFLAGAAQTAMGVAGGMMLGSLLGNALGGGGEAKAAETAQPTPAARFSRCYGDDSSAGISEAISATFSALSIAPTAQTHCASGSSIQRQT